MGEADWDGYSDAGSTPARSTQDMPGAAPYSVVLPAVCLFTVVSFVLVNIAMNSIFSLNACLYLAAGILFFAGMIVYIVWMNKRQKKQEHFSEENEKAALPEPVDEIRTVLLGGTNAAMRQVLIDSNDGTAYPLPARGTILIGRSYECDIVLKDPSVSRRQCELQHEGGVLYVRNLSTSNATKVIRRGISMEADDIAGVSFEAGDELLIGRTRLELMNR